MATGTNSDEILLARDEVSSNEDENDSRDPSESVPVHQVPPDHAVNSGSGSRPEIMSPLDIHQVLANNFAVLRDVLKHFPDRWLKDILRWLPHSGRRRFCHLLPPNGQELLAEAEMMGKAAFSRYPRSHFQDILGTYLQVVFHETGDWSELEVPHLDQLVTLCLRRIRGDTDNGEVRAPLLPSRVHISEFSTEVLGLIFEQLPMLDRYQVATVCSHWKEAVCVPRLWKNVTVTLDSWPDDQDQVDHLLHCLQTRDIRRIKTSTDFCSLRDDSIELLADHLNNLVSLNLILCRFLTNRSLEHIARSLPELKHLSVDGCTKINDEGVGYLCGGNGLVPQLLSLNLNRCPGITNRAIEHLSSGQLAIQQLDLSGLLSLTDDAFQWLAYMKELRQLNISKTHLTGSGILQLVGADNAAVEAPPPITYLDVSGCRSLTNEALEHVGRLKQLSTLKMDSTSVSDAGLEQLVRNGESPISTLSMSSCENITDDGMRHVAKLRKLRELGFDVGDTGLAHLANGQSPVANVYCREDVTDEGLGHLNNLPNLRSLYLSDCANITVAGVMECVVRGMPNLVWLSLSSAHLDDEGERALKSRVPALKSLTVDGKRII